MNSHIDDHELKSQLESFGSPITKVTNKNRQILIKKLNHFKARLAMNRRDRQTDGIKLRSRQLPSNVSLTPPDDNNDDEDADESEDESNHSPELSIRRRNIVLEDDYVREEDDHNYPSTKINKFGPKNGEQTSFENSLSRFRDYDSSFRSRFASTPSDPPPLVTDYSDTEDPVSMASVGINTSFPLSEASMTSFNASKAVSSNASKAASFRLSSSKFKAPKNNPPNLIYKTLIMCLMLLFLSVLFVYMYKLLFMVPLSYIGESLQAASTSSLTLATPQEVLKMFKESALTSLYLRWVYPIKPLLPITPLLPIKTHPLRGKFV